MLDRFIAEPRVVEIDHVDVAVPPAEAYATVRGFDLARSPFVRALFALRTMPDRLTGQATERTSMRLDDIGAQQPGFTILADEEGVGFAAGAVGKFWKPRIEFASVTPETFAEFDEPGFGRVAWAVRFEPRGEHGTRIVFELRLDATDEASWASVQRYFRLIGPFSHFIRRHFLSLMAKELGTPERAEQRRRLPGDELIGAPKAQVTRGITIEATPEEIWPWLVQMGCRRGGWYSYDLLDNAGITSATEIDPRLQDVEVGDVFPATPEVDDGFTVLRLEPPRVLVLGGTWDPRLGRTVDEGEPLPTQYWQVTWAFVLEPLDARHTRLLVRARVDFAGTAMELRAVTLRPIHWLMQTQQLRNLKRRAEGDIPRARSGLRDVGEGIVGGLGVLLNLLTPFLRHRRSHWGLDEATAEREYPGDDLVPTPRWGWTHGIEIDAPPESVWPWIAQLGQQQGGFYSYQWLENLAGSEIENANRIHDEWQEVRIGDTLHLHPQMPPMEVADANVGRWFVVHGGKDFRSRPDVEPIERAVNVSWLFFLEPLPSNKTRLISRFRSDYTDDLATRLNYGPYVTESVGFVMDRRMLIGVKDRVERAARKLA